MLCARMLLLVCSMQSVVVLFCRCALFIFLGDASPVIVDCDLSAHISNQFEQVCYVPNHPNQ